MGRRYESKRGEVNDSREEGERIRSDQETLKNEYSLLSAIDGLLSDVDDGVVETVGEVKIEGDNENSRLVTEHEENDAEKQKISGEIDQELAKLNSGLEKLNSLESYEFGRNALDKGKSEYQEQIEKFKALKEELLDAAEAGNVESISGVMAENAGLIDSLYESTSDSLDNSGISDAGSLIQGGATQSEHRPLISSHSEAINAVIDDVRLGSGKQISTEQAERLFKGVNDFSGEYSSEIREAYNNPSADPEDIERMNALDEYIKNAPKWEGQVYRGIHVTQAVADEILSRPQIDMLGAASWSSELNVAERFSIDTIGNDDVHMIFVLPENKSGASITHIAKYNGIESEITSPSGVKYNIDQVQRVFNDNREYLYVYVHE